MSQTSLNNTKSELEITKSKVKELEKSELAQKEVNKKLETQMI